MRLEQTNLTCASHASSSGRQTKPVLAANQCRYRNWSADSFDSKWSTGVCAKGASSDSLLQCRYANTRSSPLSETLPANDYETSWAAVFQSVVNDGIPKVGGQKRRLTAERWAAPLGSLGGARAAPARIALAGTGSRTFVLRPSTSPTSIRHIRTAARSLLSVSRHQACGCGSSK